MILNTDLYIEDIIFFYPFMTVKRPVLIGTGKAACSNGRLIYVYRFRCQKNKKAAIFINHHKSTNYPPVK